MVRTFGIAAPFHSSGPAGGVQPGEDLEILQKKKIAGAIFRRNDFISRGDKIPLDGAEAGNINPGILSMIPSSEDR